MTYVVISGVTAWQSCPLESMYPVVFFDALHVKICEDGLVRSAAVNLALGAVFPATTLQTCIVHMIHNSLDFASWKDRKALAAAIEPICMAISAEAAEAELDTFEAGTYGARNSRPLWVPGAGPGTGAFHSLRSHQRCSV